MESTIFMVAVLLWVLSEVVGASIVPALRRQGSKVERRNRGSNALIWIGWVVTFGLSGAFAGAGILMMPGWAFYVGTALILAGIAVRQWAIAVLGRYFSGVIGIQEGQKVVDWGPYRLVRHPSYTGALLLLVGIATALGSFAATLAAAVFALVYGHRMLAEEKVLLSELGDSYGSYMKRTKRVIPFIA